MILLFLHSNTARKILRTGWEMNGGEGVEATPFHHRPAVVDGGPKSITVFNLAL